MGERTQRDRSRLFGRHPWLYLFIVLPIPAVIAWNLFAGALISLCGLYGCINGRHPNIAPTVGALIGAVVVLAVPAALVPWHPKESLRATVSFLAAATVVGVAWAIMNP